MVFLGDTLVVRQKDFGTGFYFISDQPKIGSILNPAREGFGRHQDFGRTSADKEKAP